MRTLKLEAWSSPEYASATIRSWPKGEVREVDDGTAAYLLGTFPGLFVEAKKPAAKPKA